MWSERWSCMIAAALLLQVALGARASECPSLPRGTSITLGAYAETPALLWRIAAADGRQSHLFGTMHVGDARFARYLERARPLLVRSRHFALEIVLDENAMSELATAMFDPQGALDTELGPQLFTRASALLARHGLPTATLRQIRPWAAFMLLSQPPASHIPAIDLELLNLARGAGLAVHGLETIAEQIAVFEQIGATQSLTMLRETICHYDLVQAELATMAALYAARDLPELVRHSLKHIDAARLPLLETLIWARNDRMLERMTPLLAAGDSFIAVGALHLPGDRGLLRLLERMGYRVDAIY